MRFFALALVFSVAGCDDSGPMSNEKNDLSMSDDLSMSMMNRDGGADLAVVPDLAPLTPSGMIQQVRNAGDSGNTPDGGMLTMSIPVADVFVTYLRPEVSGETDDPPGFFVQADMNGPALFIRVDPASLSPAPQVGDQVSFTVTGAGKDAGGVHQATSLTDWMVSSSGHSLTGLVQDLSSAADLVSGLDNYESELSKVTGVVTGSFGASGAAYVQASLTTAGVSTGTLAKLRLPQSLRDSLDVVQGCTVTVGPTPLWRFNKTAQPSAWVAADITLSNCPAPQVVKAQATDLTHVVVSFDHEVKASTLLADGSQLTFDHGLAVDSSGGSAATLSAPNQVTLVTTTQTAGQLYTVTVATTIQDLRLALDAAHTTATFHGFTPPAVLQITEFNPGINSNLDLVELRALTGGSVSGFTFTQNMSPPTVLATLPDAVVQTNDLIVLHIKPSPSPSPTPETTSQTDCTAPSCYSTAWDFNGTADIGNSSRVIAIRDASGAIQDAVPFFDNGSDFGRSGFAADLAAAVAAGAWTCATNPCTATDLPSSRKCGTTAAGPSLKRVGVADTNSTADWPYPSPSPVLTNSNFGVYP